jgi:hypothetical protein
LYLENYNLIDTRDDPVTEGLRLKRGDVTFSSDRVYLDKRRDIVIFHMHPLFGIPASINDISTFNLSGLNHIALNGVEYCSQNEIQRVASMIGAGASNLRSVNFLLGDWEINHWSDDEQLHSCHLIEISSDLLDISYEDAAKPYCGYFRKCAPTPVRKTLAILKSCLSEADTIRSRYTELVELGKSIWYGVKFTVSTMVQIKGPSFKSCIRKLSLIPRNPIYSGVYFYTQIRVELQEETNGLYYIDSPELECTANCLPDGTIIPWYDNFTGWLICSTVNLFCEIGRLLHSYS